MRLLVTGLTGQLGHGLVEAVSGTDIELTAIVRRNGRRSARERVARMFPAEADRIRTIEGDVAVADWGLDGPTIESLAGRTDAVLNLAGEVDWTASTRRLNAVNLLGPVHGLALCSRLRRADVCPGFCTASSVYVAGCLSGRVAERRLGPDGHRTRYEQSKWQAEEAVLDSETHGPVLIARFGGLVGSSASGATTKRSSFYQLADGLERLPGGITPSFGRGRVDMLPRDVAGSLLLRAVRGMLQNPDRCPTIVHICAGEAAPRTDALLELVPSLDMAGSRCLRRRAPIAVPARAATWLSANAERVLKPSRDLGNAIIGLRYLVNDRVFERDRLATLVGELPAVPIELQARLVFGLQAEHQTAGALTPMSRFAA